MKTIFLNSAVMSVAAILLGLSARSSFAQRPPSVAPPTSPAPQTQWADEFGQSIGDHVLKEARQKRAAGALGPIEVTVKFTVTPYGPPIEKPTWTSKDINNLDVCTQTCTSWCCYAAQWA